jgi:hypothetical protein
MVSQFRPSTSNGFTQGLQYGSLILAFTPLIFKFHWNDVLDTQADYKKRVYAPVAMTTLLEDPVSHLFVPGMLLKFSF